MRTTRNGTPVHAIPFPADTFKLDAGSYSEEFLWDEKSGEKVSIVLTYGILSEDNDSECIEKRLEFLVVLLPNESLH